MDSNITRSFVDMEAGFSPLVNTEETGVVYVAEPLNACRNLRNKPEKSPNGTSPFVLIIRGGCTFEYKIRNARLPLSMKSFHSLGYSSMSPLNAIDRSPYRPYPSNAPPGLASSTNHTFSPFAATHSLPDCKTELSTDTIE